LEELKQLAQADFRDVQFEPQAPSQLQVIADRFAELRRRARLVHGDPGARQTYPDSTWQVELQPSPAAALPSSQFSPDSTRLLPQIEVRTQSFPAMQV
jgi:hypothetical protein